MRWIPAPVLALVVGGVSSGCWLTHDDDPPAPDGDADSDVDADADTDADDDADADADADADGDPEQRPLRPEQVCGMRDLSRVVGGTLRVLTLDCMELEGCAAVIEGGAVDLQPMYRPVGEGECAGGPTWYDCPVPPGDFWELSVWGEPLYAPCFGGDEGDCAAPDCVQLPQQPLPEGCVIEGMRSDRVCGPEEVMDGAPTHYAVFDDCGCDAKYRPGGCLSTNVDGGVLFEALAARCSDCSGDDSCMPRESGCTLFEPPAEPTSLIFGSRGGSITFEVGVGEGGLAGAAICRP